MTSRHDPSRIANHFGDPLRFGYIGQVWVYCPKSTFTIRDHFTCMPENLVYWISCRRCSHIYIGETGRSFRSRFGEHLRTVRNNNPGFPVAQHFNSTGHSIADVQVRGMRLCRGSNILRKQLEMRLIFQLGTVQPDGLNIKFQIRLNCARATFYAYALPFNVVPNILRISTVSLSH